MKSQGEIESITALRGIAALSVVLFHFHVNYEPLFLWKAVSYGFLGVDVFFVLSGFIMYYVYAPALRSGSFRYSEFITKRFARIYPVHLVTLLAITLFVLVGDRIGLAPNAKESLADFWPQLTLLYGWGVTSGIHLNYPSWSLSPEFTAYIVFPLLATPLILLSRRNAVLLAGIAAASSFFILDRFILPMDGAASIFRMGDGFAALRIVPEFSLGLGAARLVCGRERNWIAAVPLAVIAAMAASLWAGWEILFVVLVPVLLVGLYMSRLAVPGWLRFIGLISFSIYMTHALVDTIGYKLVEVIGPWKRGALPIWMLPIFLALTLLVAWLCWLIVEEPQRKRIMRLYRTWSRSADARQIA